MVAVLKSRLHLVHKAAGSCGPGERADLTGCTPASGGGSGPAAGVPDTAPPAKPGGETAPPSKKPKKEKPEHGSRASAALAKVQALKEQMQKVRKQAYDGVKKDALASLKAVSKTTPAIQAAMEDTAWVGEGEHFDAEIYELHANLETAARSLPGGHDDEELPPGEQYSRLGEVITYAKQMLDVSDEMVDSFDDESPEQKAEYKTKNKEHLTNLIKQARTARQHLREYGDHVKELNAIKAGEEL